MKCEHELKIFEDKFNVVCLKCGEVWKLRAKVHREFEFEPTESYKKIKEFVKHNRIKGLSFREIARRLDIKNVQTVIYHLEKIKQENKIVIE